MRRLFAWVILIGICTPPVFGQSERLPQILGSMNERLAATGKPFRVAGADLYTLGQGRPSARLLQLPLRFVPNDSRRFPVFFFGTGTDLAYVVDASNGATASGLTSIQTGAAIDAAMQTWDANRCARTLGVVKLPDFGFDLGLVAFLFGFGGSPPIPGFADIIHVGWLPKAFFDLLATDGGNSILGITFSFVFVDSITTQPTDINNDGYADAAFTETYYNNNWGDPGGSRPGFPWGINVALPGIDVQTVALHESGHGFGLGHFGPPPLALMNPAYSGIHQSPLSTDSAGLCTLYSSWPNP